VLIFDGITIVVEGLVLPVLVVPVVLVEEVLPVLVVVVVLLEELGLFIKLSIVVGVIFATSVLDEI
jgi:hypothetical protein